MTCIEVGSMLSVYTSIMTLGSLGTLPFIPLICDKYSRKAGIVSGSLLGVGLQARAQNFDMFIAGRFLLFQCWFIWTQLVEMRYTPLEEQTKFFDGEEKDIVDLTNASVKQVEVDEGGDKGAAVGTSVGCVARTLLPPQNCEMSPPTRRDCLHE